MERGFRKFSMASYEEAINQCSFVLPGDLVLEILQRLPVKSLLRFESTSKRWQFIIRNSNFIAKHLLYHHEKHKSKKAEMVNYLHIYHFPGCTDYSQPPFSLCFCPAEISGPIMSQGIALISSNRDDGNIITRPICHSPLSFRVQSLSIVGSCNGLVCIRFCRKRTGSRNFDCWDRCFGIWNPATRKFKLLPAPQYAPDSEFRDLSNTIVGFSYIPRTCSYKLVQILVFKTYARVEVLTLGASSWKEVVSQGQDELAAYKLGWLVDYLESSSKRHIHNLPVVAKGCLYWLGIPKHGGVVLVSFDFNKEVFTRTAFPYPIGYLKLVVLEDNLAAFNCPDSNFIEDYFEVWIYEETSRSWTKRFSFGPLPRDEHPVGFWADGDIIVKSESSDWSGGSKPYLYDPNKKEKKNFPCTSEKKCNIAFEPYIESLVDF